MGLMLDSRLEELENLNLNDAPLASDAAGDWCKGLVDECCREIRRVRLQLDIKKHRIRFLEKANESWAEKFEKLKKNL